MWHRRRVWNEDGIAEELTAKDIGGWNILDTRTRWGDNGGSINLESVESSAEKVNVIGTCEKSERFRSNTRLYQFLFVPNTNGNHVMQ